MNLSLLPRALVVQIFAHHRWMHGAREMTVGEFLAGLVLWMPVGSEMVH